MICDLQDPIESEPDLVGHSCLGNALLNLAANKILDEVGPKVTATVLLRMADAVSSGARPEGSLAVRLDDADA